MLLRLIALPLLLSILIGCTSSSGGDDSNSGGGAPGTRQFGSDCGTLVNGSSSNPVSESSGQLVTLKQVVSASTVITSGTSGDQLIRLIGIAEAQTSFSEARSKSILESALGPVILYLANNACTVTTSSGGTAAYGTLYSESSGVNLNERLITEGNAVADTSSACGTAGINNCYQALDAESVIETGAAVTNFLWKPAAERDGRLVVLLNPSASTVIANGEVLVLSGPSNGRATTARGTRNGCGYGSNVTVEAFDSLGRTLVFPGAQLSLNIPSGCQRLEF